MQALFFLPRNYLFLFAARIFIEFPKCYHAKLIVWSKYQIDQEFLDGTSPRIYPWNQSLFENRKSSSPRIYPWGQSKI